MNLNNINISSSTNIRFDNLLKAFKPTLDLLDELEIRYIIAGGCIRDYFTGTKISDIDIFTTNKEQALKILDKFSELNATIILNNDQVTKLVYNGVEYDIIKLHFPDTETLIKDFDFTVCQFAIDHTHTFYYTEEAFVDLTKRQLMVYDLHYPEASMLRVRKYLDKGFKICHEELTKIIFSIQNKAIKSIDNKAALTDINIHPITIREYIPYIKENKFGNIKNFQTNRSVITLDELDNLGFDIEHLENIEEETNNQQYRFYGID